MNQKISKFKKGDVVKANVVEVIGQGSLICSFDGQLLRVQNTSNQAIHRGQEIALIVQNLNPLEFRLKNGAAASGKARTKIDRFV